MTGFTHDPGAEAFVRLLREGAAGGQAKADAIAAMLERPMWVATWEPRAEGFRTLVNTSGEEALAIFSSESQIRESATRFGWLGPDGSVPSKQLTGKVLIEHAMEKDLAFVVVDIASTHSLEITREEFPELEAHGWENAPAPEPQRTTGGIREIRRPTPPIGPRGTYGAASVIPPKPKTSPVPPKITQIPRPIPPQARLPDSRLHDPPLPGDSIQGTAPPTAPSDSDTHARSLSPPKSFAPPRAEKARSVAPPRSMPPMPRVGSLPAPAIELAPLDVEPDGDMLHSLANVLRNYPEVEWAAYCEIRRAVGEPSPAIGLRLDPSYRENVTMMIRQLCEAGREYDIELDAVLIDQPEMMRQARASAIIFFPWRPKSLLPGS